jgi:FAD:protein FMN transferase
MATISRRRFLTIAAAAAALPSAVRAAPLHQWRGVALGANASITLAHPRAETIVARALAEIARLERIFSLHDPDSALARLNRDGRLDAPPFELLECLSLSGRVHAATGGRFDPTIQPLWAAYARAHAAGGAPAPEALAEARARVGWQAVRFGPEAVAFDRPGMALSLNGIAQGVIADKVAGMLRGEGLDEVLVDTGEHRALGGRPGGGDWPVTLDDGRRLHRDAVHLRDRALASSAPHGITFDAAGTVSHILDPASGAPAPAHWRLISVTAPQAGLADALSTAFCLMDEDAIETALTAFDGAALVHAQRG